ncbi:bacteriorhodopsin [Alteribacter aurantiacus]|uniref:bacteriorhodopsin n=1 Tax=Alteribacter aurantiacus TaxID=254410 RepID=UPI000401A4BC|nr:bacteriorhodopsin [Alteribacter aurantiacus]
MYEIEQQLLWIYVAFMGGGAVYFAYLAFHRKGVPRAEYLVAFIIPTWSGVAYASIALGQGLVEWGDRVIYFARYLDWVVTTPLLLLALAMTAMYTISKDRVIIGGLIVADVFMVLTGLIAEFSPSPIKYVWYILGVVAFLIILWIIWWPLRAKAKSQNHYVYRVFLIVAGYLSILWVGYPTVWLLGPSGLGVISQITDQALFVSLPIFSKVGFSILDLSCLRWLHVKHGQEVTPQAT